MRSAGFKSSELSNSNLAKALYFVFNLFTLNTKLKYWRTSLKALSFFLA
jgi:hypothetical protein